MFICSPLLFASRRSLPCSDTLNHPPLVPLKVSEIAQEMTTTAAPKETPKKTSDKPGEPSAVAKQEPAPPSTVQDDVKQVFQWLERSISTGESRFMTRALRQMGLIRKRLDGPILQDLLSTHLPADHPTSKLLLTDVKMGGDTKDAAKTLLPEAEIYLNLLALVYLHDQKQYDKGVTLATATVEAIQNFHRRTLDPIAGRVYFYYARFYELLGKLADIRPTLLNIQRKATLRHDEATQATVLNLLLKSYIEFNLYDQADKLISKSVFPETADNNQTARYMYYQGRIKAIQLDYTTSHHFLLQAVRKAPQTPATAGFQQAVNKWAIIVQLLMGEIPERSLFRNPLLKQSLLPYFHITQAVRVGDIAKFQDTLAKYAAAFKQDKIYTLILRLRHNVIKTGIRMMSLSYSRISLKDICLKLLLDSEEDAEYIVAKAIRDGVIDATIDHENGHMRSKENPDLYSTSEPQQAFHQRISFCLDLHNDSVKAMRFPGDAHRKELDSMTLAYEEERKLAKEIVEGELDDDEDMEDF